ncbi:hypothetical protein DP43_5852 [Burkholderia pseudomallei]|nr:hypothetical protein DP43_5852 [Burkholderia pseudomallei]
MPISSTRFRWTLSPAWPAATASDCFSTRCSGAVICAASQHSASSSSTVSVAAKPSNITPCSPKRNAVHAEPASSASSAARTRQRALIVCSSDIHPKSPVRTTRPW